MKEVGRGMFGYMTVTCSVGAYCHGRSQEGKIAVNEDVTGLLREPTVRSVMQRLWEGCHMC